MNLATNRFLGGVSGVSRRLHAVSRRFRFRARNGSQRNEGPTWTCYASLITNKPRLDTGYINIIVDHYQDHG
jgi:hypothetical protein